MFLVSTNSVMVTDLNQLKKVHLSCVTTHVQTIEIKSRNLLEFHLINSPTEHKVDLSACTKLQVSKLCIHSPRISSTCLFNFRVSKILVPSYM